MGVAREPDPRIVDSDCDPPLTGGRFAVLSSDGDEDGIQTVSVCRAPSQTVAGGSVAAAASPVRLHPLERLRYTSRNVCRGSQTSAVVVPSASLCVGV